MNKEQRVARYKYLSEKYKKLSETTYENAREMASVIPFGQPILIGHHSEKRDRAYRERIHRRFERSFEFQKKAERYAERAIAAKNNNCISSDDSDAVERLKEKIAALEKKQDIMKRANKIIRSNQTQEEKELLLCKLMPREGIERVKKLFEPSCFGTIGFERFELTNNNANINRLKKRLEQLERDNGREEKEENIKGVRCFHNVSDNRLQLFFPGKPELNVISSLKSNGFRWSPYNGCWQRMLNNQGIYAARRVLDILPCTE